MDDRDLTPHISGDAGSVRRLHDTVLSGAVHPLIDDLGLLIDRTVNLTTVGLLAGTDVPRLLAPFAARLRTLPGVAIFSDLQMHFTVCPIQAYAAAPAQDDGRVELALRMAEDHLPLLGSSVRFSLARVVVTPTAVRAIGTGSPSLVAFRKSLLADLKDHDYAPPESDLDAVHVNIARYSRSTPVSAMVEIVEAFPELDAAIEVDEVVGELSDMNQADHSVLRRWRLAVAP